MENMRAQFQKNRQSVLVLLVSYRLFAETDLFSRKIFFI